MKKAESSVRRRDAGMTLIEILVVLSILAVLMGLSAGFITRAQSGNKLLLTTTAVARDTARRESATAGDEPTISDLLNRIERLEDDKVRVQDELDALRATSGDNWLSEQRSREIRLLVEDVLADADTRSSMLQDGSTAGWDGKFFLASPDGRFRLNLGGQMQVRWIWNYHDQETEISGFPGSGGKYKYGFENTRTKLVFDGHLFTRDLTYKIQTDFGTSQQQRQGDGSSVLQDAWIRYLLTNDWALRFGQFKLPYNREHLVDSMYQQVIERSLINESANIDRSQGVELMYAGRNDTVNVALSDGGQFNVTPPQFSLPFPNPVWGGLRGGISIALALSLPAGPIKATILTATYVIVVFSVVVQGATVGTAARRLVGEPDHE